MSDPFADPLTAVSAPDQQLLALFREGRHREVVAQAQALSITTNANPLAAQVLAAALFQLGNYSQAAGLLEGLEAALGQQGDYLSLYGATCRRLGQLQRAEQLLAKALQLAPQALDVRNNYANLLIDLGRDAEARAILEQLLQEQPNYQDARANLNRLQFRQQPSAVPPVAATAAEPASSPVEPWTPADPLMLAFAEEEVKQAGAVKPAAPGSAAAALATTLPQPDAEAVAADKLKMATQAVSEGNGPFALQLCSQALAGLGANASVYVNASDAYIRNQRFLEAEICLLHGIVIGGSTINHFINLVSLASLRGDLALAAHYLDQAAASDPSHPQLATLQTNLRQRQASLEGQAYCFQPSWPEQQLQPCPSP
ncbi:tetratricopeptide repeat protein [Cyanobium sp. Aljojuca 7D2]|uniref:tetratricopeptide repeat protein n=1 Tax=Cyanobium sp. Aljojuca 7D2 TaxID=2823698 RepID=UPI0020CD5457|nr:tetratricopeptide repeat protein [Cyanobium sp. Aljojuca 7D2]MCP9891973.1 tetratricopeptide repeat protein [Cyanobium sp. Aljojuca 7D2]